MKAPDGIISLCYNIKFTKACGYCPQCGKQTVYIPEPIPKRVVTEYGPILYCAACGCVFRVARVDNLHPETEKTRDILLQIAKRAREEWGDLE